MSAMPRHGEGSEAVNESDKPPERTIDERVVSLEIKIELLERRVEDIAQAVQRIAEAMEKDKP